MTALVAREHELAAAVRAVRSGRGVVLVGDAGVGKTALAAAVAAAIPPTTWVVATAAGRLVPFGALGALLPPDLATVHPALVPRLVADRLRALAGGGSALLSIDDAQLLDEHSAAAVLSVVTSGAARVLATVRAGERASDAVTALWKDGLVERLDLAPLDRDGAAALLADRLGGVPASSTAELLWAHSQGNPLYLCELVRFGSDTGRLRADGGVWWWHGDPGVPPRLGELLQRRIDALTPAGRDAVDVLALGDGLPYEALAAVTSPEAVLDVDEHAVVSGDERDGVLRLRFAHPLLHAVAERRLTPTRRRALALRLRRAPAEHVRHVGVVQRAAWEDATGEPDVDLLLAAADATMLSDPAGSVRFAERALRTSPTPRAALALSAARSETGDRGGARAAWRVADEVAATDAERLAVGLEDIGLAMWAERDPRRAADAFARLRAELPPAFADDLDTTEAVLALFTARLADALRLADAALARPLTPSARVRALTARLAAVTLTERSRVALAAAADVLAALDMTPVAATRVGLAHAFVAEARMFHERGVPLPAVAGGSGRWPAVATASPTGPAPAWPLLVGIRHHLIGDHARATVALREALVQQRAGEGLFRSEAAASLVVVLAESGHGDEAARLLDEAPPDAVACVPGLLPWARAAVAAADGPTAAAGESALAAAVDALTHGAVPTALWYLADACRFGGRATARAAAELLPTDLAASLSRTRADGVRAHASRDPEALLAAAERHLTHGLCRHAAELAALVPRAARDPRAARVRREAQARVGPVPAPGEATAPALTPRELEIARLAASGLSDRDIASALVVSARTVETHLRSVYRKLDIGSRRALADALRPPGDPATGSGAR